MREQSAGGRPAGSHAAWFHGLVAALLVVGVGGYLSSFVNRGWIPHDEGLLAQSAERFLGGEIPHRDFDDAYTGGLTILHGLAFKLMGVRLTSIRACLFIFSLGFVATLYFIAARRGPWWLAILTVLTCVAWSVPNYFAALPSWHILFLTALGTLALLKYADTDRRGWLFVAGVCGGLGLTVKIVALYYIAAALLFLVYRGQVESASQRDESSTLRRLACCLTTAAVGMLLIGLLMVLLRHDLRPPELLNYVLPCSLLSALLVWNEWREGGGAWGSRFRRAALQSAYLLAGVALPALIFLIPYLPGDGLWQLFEGAVLLPQRRLAFAREPLQPLLTMLPALLPGLIVLLVLITHFRGKSSRGTAKWIWTLTLLFAIPAIFLLLSSHWYYWNFFSLRGLLPLLVAVCCLVLATGQRRLAGIQRQEIFLLASIATLGSLIQFPFAALIYFCYCAPLVLLCAHFLLASQQARLRVAQIGLFAFFLLFGSLRMNAAYCTDPSNPMREQRNELSLRRGGLLIPQKQLDVYMGAVELVRQHSAPDSYIFAAPDCPEVYFLSERRNPTRSMYDFFDDQEGRTERLTKLLDERRVQVVVLNEKPWFSPTVDASLRLELERRFPLSSRVGPFVVRWSSSDEPAPRAVEKDKLGYTEMTEFTDRRARERVPPDRRPAS